MLHGQTLLNAVITLTCSCLSLTGSSLIILSYVVTRSRSTPKAAYLILHLAVSDFFWFLSSSLLSALWLLNNGHVPAALCYLASPTISFTRMASLIWTVCISFNVLMSVQKRKWYWKSQEEAWESYRKIYFGIIFILAFPGTLLSIVKQHTASSGLGCSPGYEPLGVWYEIFFTELLPIAIGFACNIYVFMTVRSKMSKSAFPQSVRKRRKRVMYHYIIVCILSWIPTIAQYIVEICGFHSVELEIFARTSLYASGFSNFLVFGMQDPHLKRSFDVVLEKLGCAACFDACGLVTANRLKQSDVEKVVMFEEKTIVRNADISKDKKSIYRNRKLSREDKAALYKDRPDLNPKFRIAPAPKKVYRSRSNSTSDDIQMEEPLLDNQHTTETDDQIDLEGDPHGEGEYSDNSDSMTHHDMDTLSSISASDVANVLLEAAASQQDPTVISMSRDSLSAPQHASPPPRKRQDSKHVPRPSKDQIEDDDSSEDEGDEEDEDLNAL